MPPSRRQVESVTASVGDTFVRRISLSPSNSRPHLNGSCGGRQLRPSPQVDVYLLFTLEAVPRVLSSSSGCH